MRPIVNTRFAPQQSAVPAGSAECLDLSTCRTTTYFNLVITQRIMKSEVPRKRAPYNTVPSRATTRVDSRSSPDRLSQSGNVPLRKYRTFPLRRQRPSSSSWLALCVIHVLLVVAIGIHNEWAWSTELLRLFTDLAVGTVSTVTLGTLSANDDVTSSVSLDEYQNVSLRERFSLDWNRVLMQRKRNMLRYNYTYGMAAVDKRTGLSLEEFHDVYDGKWPVILQDVLPTWKAFNWTRDYLCSTYGQERVAMKGVRGELSNAETVSLPLGAFCEHINESSPNQWTYIEDELFLPSRRFLRSDVGLSIYTKEDYFEVFPEEIRPWDAMLLWGTRFSRSSLHIDPYNWTGTNAVIRGRKQWKLFPPGQDHLLYVYADRKSNFPLNCYKYNRQATFLEVDQLPGELLIIPTGWFHQAFNAEETIAVSGQMTNVHNYRVVLEEILKLDGNLARSVIPPESSRLHPYEQVKLVISLLSRDILERGRKITENHLNQMQFRSM